MLCNIVIYSLQDIRTMMRDMRAHIIHTTSQKHRGRIGDKNLTYETLSDARSLKSAGGLVIT